MSRIGKKPIKIPSGVEIKVTVQTVHVKGPKGELERTFPEVLDIRTEENQVFVSLKNNDQTNFKFWGLGRALLLSMITGVSSGFEKSLEFSGVGYKAQVKGDTLELSLGYNNPVVIKTPTGISFKIEKNTIKVSGIDKELVGQTAAVIRDARPPEPYKGSGIKYKGEVIIRKAGKKAVATAG